MKNTPNMAKVADKAFGVTSKSKPAPKKKPVKKILPKIKNPYDKKGNLTIDTP